MIRDESVDRCAATCRKGEIVTAANEGQAGRTACGPPRLVRLSQPGGPMAAFSTGSNLSPFACSANGQNAALTCNATGVTADSGCLTGTAGVACVAGGLN